MNIDTNTYIIADLEKAGIYFSGHCALGKAEFTKDYSKAKAFSDIVNAIAKVNELSKKGFKLVIEIKKSQISKTST